MLDQFQVADLPMSEALLALETASLRHVSSALAESECRAVLLLEPGTGRLRGVVMRDVVERLGARLAEMHVGMLPVMGVVELPPTALLVEAARLVAVAGVGAVVCRKEASLDPQLVLRGDLLALDDWAPLVEARARRLVRPGEAQAPAVRVA